LAFESEGERVDIRDASALDAVLTSRRVSGEADTYALEASAWFGDRDSRDGWEAARGLRAAKAAGEIHAELDGFRQGIAASDQIRTLSGFLRRHHRPIAAV